MYAVAVVIAPAVSPVFCGLIVSNTTWRVLFWLILGMAGLQLVLFFFLVPETLWVVDETPQVNSGHALASSSDGDNVESERDVKGQPSHVEASQSELTGHCGVAWYPWERPGEFFAIFMSPILMVRYLAITIPSIYYGSVFAWSVGITIVMPQKFEKPPYNFSEIPLGAAFLAYGVGGVLGKWSGGIVGDKTVTYFERKRGNRQPEHRLWALVCHAIW